MPADKLPAAAPSAFYRKLNATLAKMDFARSVWAICEPAYANAARGGRPGIDPVVYQKPGGNWQVAYGRGWEGSRLLGVTGREFVRGVNERAHAAEFSQVEHLRWLAAALPSKERAEAVMVVAHAIQESLPVLKVDFEKSDFPELRLRVSPAQYQATPPPGHAW